MQETIKTEKRIRNYNIEVITPFGDTESYLVSTAIIEELSDLDTGVVLILHDISEVTRLRKIALQMDRYGEIIGNSEKMKNIFALIETLTHYDYFIFIL